VVVVFIEDDDDELIRMALKKMQVSIISLVVRLSNWKTCS
jgi:hypothetical protein